jgi:hypothetical protein
MRMVAAFALFGATACSATALRDATHPHFLNGNDAARWIDRNYGDVIAAARPEITVGPASCPLLLNLTGAGSSGRCTIPVASRKLRVDFVSPDGVHETLRDVDVLIVERVVERDLADQLWLLYAIPFTVRCEGDAVRLVPAEAPLACTATGPDGLRKVLEAQPTRTGSALATELPGYESALSVFLGRDVAERREGGVALAGRTIERYLEARAGERTHAELARRGLLGSAHCPRRVVVRGSSHAACTVAVGGNSLRYDIRFDDGRGLVIADDRVAVPLAFLDEFGTRIFKRQLHANGSREAVVVQCGTGSVALVEPGSRIPCTVRTFHDSSRFDALVLDAAADVRFVPVQS